MTDATTTTFPGITILDYTCWKLEDEAGWEYDDGDGYPHYETEDKAREAAAKTARNLHPVRLDAPCFIAVAKCGHRLDEEFRTMHAETAGEAYNNARSVDWRVFNGELLCAGPYCDTCKPSEAEMLADGTICQPGMPFSCGDAHTAGQCFREATTATEGAAR